MNTVATRAQRWTPINIASVVLGFAVWWPVGIAAIAYVLGAEASTSCSRTVSHSSRVHFPATLLGQRRR